MKHQQDPTEQMAVMPDITSKPSGLILCLSGPSGVGKDTVIRSCSLYDRIPSISYR